ncbi:hypothetical protein SODALDRAFT_33709 [Sodiomyces alkalinus F11]|uniref:2EXR domain-containing protein n=1 Tax=Sodiomyces alkalinus (strain CBS 110278 / VKM F-3762 / F11) TaxID=1314773 RepID=A0A3N2Q9A9_SODAK|nr:hypothetical protein SODALDRAFT_33709 [Sodiomyces alkalinus F11]ROT43215.1 hypothetical protein SODALDRAFT_33709 [Sodiomyces alkalinus F11]
MSRKGEGALRLRRRLPLRLRKAIDTVRAKTKNLCSLCVQPFQRNDANRNICRKGEGTPVKQKGGPSGKRLRRPLKTFHPFQRLPTELRMQIWSLAIPERVVSFAHPRNAWGRWRPLDRGIPFGPPFVINTLKGSFHTIALLRVNREARAAAMWYLYGRGPPLPQSKGHERHEQHEGHEGETAHWKINEETSWGGWKRQWDPETSPNLFSPMNDTAVIPFRDAITVDGFAQPRFAPIVHARRIALLVEEPGFRHRCRLERLDPLYTITKRRTFLIRVAVALISWLPGGEWTPPVPSRDFDDMPVKLDHLKELETVTLVFRKYRMGSSSKRTTRTMPGPRTRIVAYEPKPESREEEVETFSVERLLEDILRANRGLERFYGRAGPVLAVRESEELASFVAGTGLPPGVQLQFGKIEDPDAWKDEMWYRGQLALRVSAFVFLRLPVYAILAPVWSVLDCFGL